MTLYSIAKSLLTVILKLKGYKIEGLENFPAEGPVIVASNHISLWDPIIVGCALPRKVFFMAKEDLFQRPMLNKLFEELGAFPVKRGQGDINAIRKALTILKEGKILGIFPEGTRSKTGNVQEAMAGIAFIMEKSKAPILPVRVYGSNGLLQQKRGNIGIMIGKPIYADRLVIPQEIENRRIWVANEVMSIVSKM